MKYCLLINDAPFLIEFLGKLSYEIIKGGEECVLVVNSKIAEYSKKQHFPKNIKIISKVDWAIGNYQKGEKNFDDLSWKEFFPDYDRVPVFKWDYEKSVESMNQMYQFFNFVFKTEKPDVLIHEPPANLFSLMGYHFCRIKNVKYLGLIASRIEGRTDLYDLEYTYSKYKEYFNKVNNIPQEDRELAVNFLDKFLKHEKLPAYMKAHSISGTTRIKNYFKRGIENLPFWIKYISERNKFKNFDFDTEKRMKHSIFYPLESIKIKIKKILNKGVYDNPQDDDKFFLFPLHIQPEASTSVLATYFYDQVNTVKNIAFSLPFPYKLYVKEHPVVRGDRPFNFYKKLKMLPNVVLISPSEDTQSLINNSQGIVTLTSTIGMESALIGKPTYVLGNVFYSYHPFCRKIKNFDELREEIKKDLNKHLDRSNLENINIRFIISYLTNTIKGVLAEASEKQDNNDYDQIYLNIKKFLF